MKIPVKKLEEHLSKDFANLYIICGDEPILVKEARIKSVQKLHHLVFPRENQ